MTGNLNTVQKKGQVKTQEDGPLQPMEREEINPADTLILEFSPSEMQENKFLSFRPPILW